MVVSRQSNKTGASGRWWLESLDGSDPKAAFQLSRDSGTGELVLDRIEDEVGAG